MGSPCHRLFFAVAIVFCLLIGRHAAAANGAVLQVSSLHGGSGVHDLCYDPTGDGGVGSFWILGILTGEICEVSVDLDRILTTIPNPHGVGSFPTFVLSYGIAYRPATETRPTDTLFVLAQSGANWNVIELSKVDGTEIASFTFSPPDPATASLRSLTYDTDADLLFTVDEANDQVYATSVAGVPTGDVTLSFDFPGSDAEYHGGGICFEMETDGPRLYMTYGDIFSTVPSRIIQLTRDGDCTGVEIPLLNMDTEEINGIQTFRLGSPDTPLRRVMVVGSEGTLFNLEQVLPTTTSGEFLPAPSHLRCNLTLTNLVELSWINNGPEPDRSYQAEIQILRNGIPLVTIAGSATSYLDSLPSEGPTTYSVRAANTAQDYSPESFPCSLTVGPGGIVQWAPFPTVAPYDVATDSLGNKIFITDDIGIAGEGKILQFGADLEQVGEIPSPWAKPGPIAFVPAISVVVGIDNEGNEILVEYQDVLAVGNVSDTTATQIKVIDLAGTVLSTFQFARNEIASDERIHSLTYIPTLRRFAFIVKENPGRPRILVCNETGNFLFDCRPPKIFVPFDLVGPLAYDDLRETFLGLFEDGRVLEFFTDGTCAVVQPEFAFPLDSLGSDHAEEGFVGGISILRNTLIVGGRSLGAVFQLLLSAASNPFIRGDANQDNGVDITDAIYVANFLFGAGPDPMCADAADANDDGRMSISDCVAILYVVALGAFLPDPFPDAGQDPRGDTLSCGEVTQ